MKRFIIGSIAVLSTLVFSGCGNNDNTTTSSEGSSSSDTVFSGVLDTTFGTSGILTDNNASGGDSTDQGKAITIDSNGKIYVAGSSTGSTSSNMALWRYESNGILDTTFGEGDGIVTDNNASNGAGITLDSNGKIYVTGQSYNGSNFDMALLKYESNGSLDTTFGTDGIVIENNASGGNGHDQGYAVTLDSNGKIYVAGYSTGSNYDMALWRYESNGTLDTTFGTDGIVIDNNASGGNYHDYGYAITLDSNGKICIAGQSYNGSNYDMALWRYESNGTLDTTFGGGDGIVTDNNASGGNGHDQSYAVTLDSNGKIYVAGNSWNGSDVDMALWRYESNGTLDTTFGGDGIVTFDGGSTADYGYSVILDTDGNIIVSGKSNNKAVIVMFDTNGNIAQSSFATSGYYLETTTSEISGSAFNSDKSRLYVTGTKSVSNYDMAIWKFK